MPTATVSREIHLAMRPRGTPGPDAFSWAARPVPDPAKARSPSPTFTCPSIRTCAALHDGPSYMPPWPVAGPLDGTAVGIEAMPDAFLGLDRGENTGEMVVRLGEPR